MSVSKGIALVTGSAQGIGRSIALRLARDGFDITLNDVPSKEDQLRAVADDINKIGKRTHVIPADVSIEDDVKRMVQSVTEELGGLDVMVANAGIAHASVLLNTQVDDWERVMAVNARGTFLCYKYAAAQMVSQGRGGRIIGASSIAGKMGYPAAAAYSASKFVVRSLTQSAALELGRHNITVNCYAPGIIQTAMSATFFDSRGGPEVDQEMVKWCEDNASRRAIKSVGQPEDVSNVVSFLASKESHFITGKHPR